MDAQTIQNRIYKGYGVAGAKLGQAYSQYRPVVSSLPALDPAHWLSDDLMISFNAQDMRYGRPNGYGQALWYGLLDGTQVQAGDCFTGPEGTFFLPAMQLDLPFLMVAAPRLVTVSQSPTLSQTGAIGARPAADETVKQAACPASILAGGGGAGLDVPSDTRNPGFTVLMPQVAGVCIEVNDILSDDLGRRYAVASSELSDMGWRLSATQIVVSRQSAIGGLMGTIR